LHGSDFHKDETFESETRAWKNCKSKSGTITLRKSPGNYWSYEYTFCVASQHNISLS
jgi:hypothetical protein